MSRARRTFSMIGRRRTRDRRTATRRAWRRRAPQVSSRAASQSRYACSLEGGPPETSSVRPARHAATSTSCPPPLRPERRERTIGRTRTSKLKQAPARHCRGMARASIEERLSAVPAAFAGGNAATSAIASGDARTYPRTSSAPFPIPFPRRCWRSTKGLGASSPSASCRAECRPYPRSVSPCRGRYALSSAHRVSAAISGRRRIRDSGTVMIGVRLP